MRSLASTPPCRVCAGVRKSVVRIGVASELPLDATVDLSHVANDGVGASRCDRQCRSWGEFDET